MLHEVPGLIEELLNRTTWQVAYGSMLEQRQVLREEGRTDDDIHRMALDNIQKFAVVGVQEDIPGFGDRIRERYGVELQLQKMNVTKQRDAMFDIPVETIRKIQEWVWMDLELFEFIRRMGK